MLVRPSPEERPRRRLPSQGRGRPRPAHFIGGGPGPSGGAGCAGWGQGVGPGVVAAGQAEGVGGGGGDQPVAERAGVEPVRAPDARVAGHGVQVGLGDGDTMAAGGSADAVVEGGDAGADRACEWADPRGVGEGERGDTGALGGERGEHRLQVPGDLVDVAPRPQQVVDPGDDGGQVGPQREGGRELLGVDLSGEPPAYGQIGVLEAGAVRCELLGEPVGPSAQARHVVAVADPLGLTVAQRHVTQVPRVSAGHGWPASPGGR